MREVARSRNLLNSFVTTLKRLFESVMGTLFCLLLYIHTYIYILRTNKGREARNLSVTVAVSVVVKTGMIVAMGTV